MRQLGLENRIIPLLCFILGVSICVSTALMSAAYCIIILLVLFRSNLIAMVKEALANKFVLFSLAFYLFFVLASCWSIVSWHDSFKMLTRIHGYLFAPLFYVAFSTNNSAKLLLKGFIVGAVLTALLSVISFLLDYHILYGVRDHTWVVFHGHILHNAFLAIAGGMLLLAAFSKQFSKSTRILCGLAYILCLVDVLFIVFGRTGQVLYIILTLFVLVYQFRFKSLIFIIALFGIVAPLLYMSPAIKAGVAAYNSDMSKYKDGDAQTSVGARLVFHQVSVELIKLKPLLGYGTGSFTAAYTKYATVHNIKQLTTNPHRDILWVVVEGGGVAGLLFVLMIIFAIQESLKLSFYYSGASLSVILGYLVASLQNSFFVDNVTGMAFVFIVLGLMVIGFKYKNKSPIADKE
jgi:hypothetical protein